MLKSKFKRIIISLVAVFMVIFITSNTFATSKILDKLNEISQNTDESTVEKKEELQDIPEVKVQEGNKPDNTKADNTNKDNTSNKLNENTAPTTTPYAGIGDYSTYIFIGVFIVSAIYAYKKIKDYE